MNVVETLRKIKPIDGWLSSHEGYFLYETARLSHLAKAGKATEGIVEIGSWMGKSTICLAAGSQMGSKVQVIAIDPHKGTYSWGKGIGKKSPTYKAFQNNISKAGVKKMVTTVLATSEKAARNWKKPIGFLFIDGLHDYKHTLQDFSLWSPFVAKGGLIALHDAFCGHDGPERIVLKKILPANNFYDIGVVGSIIYARKGKRVTLLQRVNFFRHQILIPLAILLNKSKLEQHIKFFLIHRIMKLLLINSYTIRLQLKKV